MSGIIRSIVADAKAQAAELRAKSAALRSQADQADHDANVLEMLDAVAATWQPRPMDEPPVISYR